MKCLLLLYHKLNVIQVATLVLLNPVQIATEQSAVIEVFIMI